MTLTEVSAEPGAAATAAAALAGIFLWQGWCSWCTQHGEPIIPGTRWPVHDPDAITHRVGGQIEQATMAARWGKQIAAWTDEYDAQRGSRDHPGVLAYDVWEPLGWWWASQVASDQLPVNGLGSSDKPAAAMRGRLHTLLEEFHSQWAAEDPGHDPGVTR
jgi:hypothetical protein